MHGMHQFEASVWVQRVQANDNLAQDQYGQASFGSLSAFLQGTISTFTVVPTPTALSWRSWEGAGFVQDVIKLRRNLVVRMGFPSNPPTAGTKRMGALRTTVSMTA
jgi:hypothetical protein